MDTHGRVAEALKTPGLYYFTLAVVVVVGAGASAGLASGGIHGAGDGRERVERIDQVDGGTDAAV